MLYNMLMDTDQLPEKFLEKLPTYIPSEKLQAVLHSFSVKRSITFRTNTIKITSQEVEKGLRSLGFEIEHIYWCEDAFILKNKSKEELMNTKLYKEGKIYIQNLSSMIPPLVLSPQPEEIILDMAASPGSKTTELATLMHNTGIIIANDKSPKRLFKLLENLKTQGVTNTKTSAIPGEFLWKKYPEYFDGVLLDAPCSMEGRFTTNDPNSYKDWSPRKIKELSNLQKWMLRSAISCTKIGGTIVYSTCAMSPEENEEVIDWLLKKMGDAITIEELSLEHLPKNPGLTQWGKKQYNPALAKTLRIYPSTLMEGFFVAKIKKHASTIVLQ